MKEGKSAAPGRKPFFVFNLLLWFPVFHFFISTRHAARHKIIEDKMMKPSLSGCVRCAEQSGKQINCRTYFESWRNIFYSPLGEHALRGRSAADKEEGSPYHNNNQVYI